MLEELNCLSNVERKQKQLCASSVHKLIPDNNKNIIIFTIVLFCDS